MTSKVEWYTPPEVVEAARRTLGAIDLDPASCEVANSVVRAAAYYSPAEDGLRMPWNGRVLVNPPGGSVRVGGRPRSVAALWWAKLIREVSECRTTAAIFVGFNMEIIRHAQNESDWFPLDFPTCFPAKRLRFWTMDAGRAVEAKSPDHANVIVYVGQDVNAFRSNFEQFGRVVIPRGYDSTP